MAESKTIVVTGGCGYLGSVTSLALKRHGYTPVLLDNFSTSHQKEETQKRVSEKIFNVQLTDLKATEAVFAEIGPVHGIIHFAAFALVPESVQNPWSYFNNNINATLSIAECAVKFRVPHVIHSSSCAVYGIPQNSPITEDSPMAAITPYGESKVIAEGIFNQFTRWKHFHALNLRYFNPAGADLEGFLGEQHQPETHLIPNLIRHFEAKTTFEIFGDDYPTPDGTCIRDYLHVKDLAEAHLLALRYLENHPELKCEAINIGTGRGVSVRQIVAAAENVLGDRLKIAVRPRRSGDPAELVAAPSKMKSMLQWEPKRGIHEMIKDHWQFQRSISKM